MREVFVEIKSNLIYFSTIDMRVWLATATFFVLMFVLVFLRQKDKSTKDFILVIILALLSAFIVVVTLTGRSRIDDSNWEWKLFSSYEKAIETKNMALTIQICFNIVAFIPLGLLISALTRNSHKYLWTLATVFFATTCIEVIQGTAKIGFFESDDIMNNLVGTGIGMGVHYVFSKLNAMLCVRKGEKKC